MRDAGISQDEKAALPDQGGAADGIVVTYEMVEAGIDVLLEHCPDSALGDYPDQKMVAEIYCAMAGRATGRGVPWSVLSALTRAG